MTSVVEVAAPTPKAAGEPTNEQVPQRISGLDAIRGFAVAVVVAFHAWPSQIPGGFVGVPVFFTLSGFLIVGMVARDLECGEFSAFRFWARRVRRLLPASVCTLTIVTVALVLSGRLTSERISDLLGALLNVTNFQQIHRAESYRVGTDQSPVLHYWSLSIEEQFYLLLPVLILVLRGSLRALKWTMAGLLVASLTFIAVQAGDAVVVYYSTASRSAEILIGACLALATLRIGTRSTNTVRWAGPLAAGSVVALLCLALTTSTSDRIYAYGGLLVVALLSAALVHALPRWTAAAEFFDRSPLGSLGRISYAVYLIHWPLLVGLRSWLGTPSLMATTLAVVASVVIAIGSSRWLENPIRRRGGIAPRRTVLVALAAVLVGAITLTMLPTTASDGDDLSARLQEIDERNDAQPAPVPVRRVPAPVSPVSVPGEAGAGGPMSAPGAPVVSTDDDETSAPTAPRTSAPTTTVAAGPRGPVTYAMLGDSKALALGLGMISHDETRVAEVYSWTDLWCPVVIGGDLRPSASEPAQSANPDCDWRSDWTRELAVTDQPTIDLAIADFGTWDIVDRRLDELGGGWTGIESEEYQGVLFGQMEEATALLRARGARRVAWMTLWTEAGSRDSEKAAIYNSLLRQLAERHPDDVRVIDFAAWMESTGEADRLLPDGVHSTWDPEGGTAREIGSRFLVDAILTASST